MKKERMWLEKMDFNPLQKGSNCWLTIKYHMGPMMVISRDQPSYFYISVSCCFCLQAYPEKAIDIEKRPLSW